MESAIDLARAITELSEPDVQLPVGIGVHAGTAYVGRFGRSDVSDFTALGDTVNIAARLQGEAKAGEIVVSDALYSSFATRFPGAIQRSVQLKGKEAPTLVWISHNVPAGPTASLPETTPNVR